MKELWYISTILLFFGALAGFANTPTGAFASNLPPTWELPTDEFSSADGKITIPLEKAFFDPDGDTIAFSTETKEATATIQKGGLYITVENKGTVEIFASDGKMITAKRITVIKA